MGGQAPRERTPLILDCDPGHDDAVAILLAAADPAAELLGVTAVAGNQTVDKTSYNARRVLTLAGRKDVPVAAGFAGPLVGELTTAEEVHGSTGLDGAELPEPALELDSRHGVDLLIETVLGASRPVVLVPTAPLTNVAVALRKEPRLKGRIARIVWMGGAAGEGNVTPAAEFNAFADPEAAAMVFSAGIPLTMVGLDVTHQALLEEADLAWIRALGAPVGTAVADLLDFYRSFHRRRYACSGFPLHDACAVAEALHPGLVRTLPMAVEVETAGRWTRGRTVCDRWGVWEREPNAQVGVSIDREAFVAYLRDTLGRYRRV